MLVLARWEERHRVPFAAMHAEPEVMADQGGPFGRARAEAKFDRYVAAWERHGIGRWALEDGGGGFLGYAGVMVQERAGHPLGTHREIGWRLRRSAWGRGIAVAGARQALERAWTVSRDEVLSYTAPDNRRSRAVMERLELRRDASRDFTAAYGGPAPWHGLVWVADPPPVAESRRAT